MDLLPLVLSAHASAWNPAGAPGRAGGQVARPALDVSCRFCGLDAAGWQEPFHLDGDHANTAPGNVVDACPLCHLCQHLDRPRIQEEAALIWLPQRSQADVVALARAVHLVLHAHGEPAHLGRGRPARDTPALRAAWTAFDALRARAVQAEERLSTSSPLDFATALLTLSPAARARGAVLVRGLRLLPLGRLYQDGRDVYPQVLDCWAWASAPPPASGHLTGRGSPAGPSSLPIPA